MPDTSAHVTDVNKVDDWELPKSHLETKSSPSKFQKSRDTGSADFSRQSKYIPKS